MKLLKKYIQAILSESATSRIQMSDELSRNDMWPANPGNKSGGNDMFRDGRTLKSLFHKYADKEFTKSLITVHWANTASDITFLLKNHASQRASRDEISCSAYLDEYDIETGVFGKIGLQIKGHISLLANDMDDIRTGKMKNYDGQWDTHRTKSSGMKKGINTIMTHQRLASPHAAPLILDIDDWDPTYNQFGLKNEAVVANWSPVAVIVQPGEELIADDIADKYEELTGTRLLTKIIQ
jgi:hypothetical protein